MINKDIILGISDVRVEHNKRIKTGQEDSDVVKVELLKSSPSTIISEKAFEVLSGQEDMTFKEMKDKDIKVINLVINIFHGLIMNDFRAPLIFSASHPLHLSA